MADISIGDITARLTLDSTSFGRAIQDAIRTLQQFAQTKDQIIQNMQRLQSQGQQAGQSFQQFNTQLNQTNQQFNQTNNTLNQTNQQFNQFNQTINNVTNNMNRATQGAQNFQNAWSQIRNIAAGIGLETSIQGLVRAFTEFLSESVQFAARMQDLSRSFTAITGSAATAQRTLTEVFQVAQRAGVGFEEAARGLARLQAGARGTTLSMDQINRAFEGIVLGARAMGVTTQQTEQALVAWEQILTKGRLSAEELVRQLGNAIPGGLAIAAQAFGVTTSRLREMAESGLAPASAAFIGFGEAMRAIGERAGGIEGLSATFARLHNETKAWMDALGSWLGTTLLPVLNQVLKISEDLRRVWGIGTPGTGTQGPQAPQAPQTGVGGVAQWLPWIYQHLPLPFIHMLPAPGPFGGQAPPPPAPAPTAGTAFNLAESRYTEAITRQAGAARIDPGLLSQLIRVESNFNPFAESRAGALGLGQLMPATAQQLQPGITREQLLAPETNIQLAARYLAQMLEAFKDTDDQVRLALTAYQSGVGTVRRLLGEATRRNLPGTLAGITQIPQAEGGLGPEGRAYAGRILEAPGTRQLSPQEMTEVRQRMAGGWAQDIAEALQQFESLRKQVEDLSRSSENFGGRLNKDVQQSADRLLKTFTDMQGLFVRFPEMAEQLPSGLRETITEYTRLASIWREGIMTDEHRLQLLKQHTEQLEQQAIRQRAILVEQRQGAEAAEQYTRDATRALQEQRIQERPEFAGLTPQQQIAEYERRIAALRNQVGALGAEIEAQRVKALTPGLEAELTRIDVFLGRATEDRAVQARENVLAQGDAMRKTLEEIGRQVAQHPGLQAVQEHLQNILQTFETDLVAVSERAYNEAKVLQRAPEFQAGAARSAQYFEQQRDALRALREENEQLQEPRQQGFPVYTRTVEQEIDRINARQQARTGQGLFTDEEGRRNARQLLEQQRGLERATYYAGLFEQFGNSVGNAWTQALTSIAQGTQTVSQAFRQMAQSILQSMAQIAAQEGFRALIRLGVGLITGSLTAGAGGGAGAGSTPGSAGGASSFENTSFIGSQLGQSSAASSLFSGLQTGGIVRRPSFHLLGEAGPEAVVPLNRMREFAQSVGPSAGGQAMGGISIINVATEAEAQRQKSQQESLGRKAVINYVMQDLSQGEGSQISRAIRVLQR